MNGVLLFSTPKQRGDELIGKSTEKKSGTRKLCVSVRSSWSPSPPPLTPRRRFPRREIREKIPEIAGTVLMCIAWQQGRHVAAKKRAKMTAKRTYTVTSMLKPHFPSAAGLILFLLLSETDDSSKPIRNFGVFSKIITGPPVSGKPLLNHRSFPT